MDCSNWRVPENRNEKKQLSFTKANTGETLKFCPGQKCKRFYTVDKFRANTNMNDKLDKYCTKCNANKRRQRRSKQSERPAFVQRENPILQLQPQRSENVQSANWRREYEPQNNDSLSSAFENTGPFSSSSMAFVSRDFMRPLEDETEKPPRTNAFIDPEVIFELSKTLEDAKARYANVQLNVQDLCDIYVQQSGKCALSHHEFEFDRSHQTRVSIVLDKIKYVGEANVSNVCLVSNQAMNSKFAQLRF